MSFEPFKDDAHEIDGECTRPWRRSRMAEGRHSPSQARAASSWGGAHLGMRD